MQKSSKFLISDLIADQSAMYASRPVSSLGMHGDFSHVNEQEYQNGLLVKSREKTQTHEFNEILYTQLNEFFVKKKSAQYPMEPSVIANHDAHPHQSGSAQCNCISCQALRFFNLVNPEAIQLNRELNFQKMSENKNSSPSIISKNIIYGENCAQQFNQKDLKTLDRESHVSNDEKIYTKSISKVLKGILLVLICRSLPSRFRKHFSASTIFCNIYWLFKLGKI